MYEEAKKMNDKDRRDFKSNMERYSLYANVPSKPDPNTKRSTKVPV